MLFVGWEGRIVKNGDRGGQGQHFQVRGHSFSLYGPTLSRQITYLFFSCHKLAYNWVYETLLVAVYKPSQKNLTSERASNSDKERSIKEQIYFELLYVSCI